MKIDVPDFDGFRCLGMIKPRKGQYYLDNVSMTLDITNATYKNAHLIVYEKIQPKIRKFRESPEKKSVKFGQLFIDSDGYINTWVLDEDSYAKHTVLEEIEDEHE